MEDKEQKIKISFETNADQVGGKVDGLTEKLGGATKGTDDLGSSQKAATKSSKELGAGIESLGGPIGGAVSGFKAMLKQMWLLVANPIGAVLALIVGAVVLLGKAFLSTEEGGNKLSKGISVVSGLFSGLLKVLEPIASFLVDKIASGFEAVGNTVLVMSEKIQGALKAIGLDGLSTSLENTTKAITGNINASQKLADLESKLNVQSRLSQKIQLDYQNTAEKLRQLRDDETNSIPKRIELNNQLSEVLKKQSKEELKAAYLSLKIANTKIALEGKSTGNLQAQAEARTLISDINERISGQESEQLANANSLRNEQKATAKEQAAIAKEKSDKAKADAKVIQDKKDALIKEGIDAESALRKANEDLSDKTEEQKLARQKQRAIDEIEALKKKGIDVAEITRLNAEKYATLEQELSQKRIDEKKIVDQKAIDDQKVIDDKAFEDAKIQAEKELQIQRDKLEQERAIQDAKLGLAQKGIALLGSIFGKSKKAQKAALLASNAVGLAEVSINTVRAVAKDNEASPLTFGMPWAGIHIAQGALGAGSIIASTAKGLKELGGGNAGSATNISSPSGSGGGNSPTSSAPQVSFQASSENQLANTISNNNKDQPPIKAFVVGKDITTQQSLDNNKIKSNSI